MTPPTITAVWEAFVALSASWDAKHEDVNLLRLIVWADGSGAIENADDDIHPMIYFMDFADALTAIAEARAGLEG